MGCNAKKTNKQTNNNLVVFDLLIYYLGSFFSVLRITEIALRRLRVILAKASQFSANSLHLPGTSILTLALRKIRVKKYKTDTRFNPLTLQYRPRCSTPTFNLHMPFGLGAVYGCECVF
jgi:hypothetical protein